MIGITSHLQYMHEISFIVSLLRYGQEAIIVMNGRIEYIRNVLFHN